jgi:hypothetical protein
MVSHCFLFVSLVHFISSHTPSTPTDELRSSCPLDSYQQPHPITYSRPPFSSREAIAGVGGNAVVPNVGLRGVFRLLLISPYDCSIYPPLPTLTDDGMDKLEDDPLEFIRLDISFYPILINAPTSCCDVH